MLQHSLDNSDNIKRELAVAANISNMLIKGGFPIGTIRNGYKKIADTGKGDWEKYVPEEEKPKEAVETSSPFTKEKMLELLKTSENYTVISAIVEYAKNHDLGINEHSTISEIRNKVVNHFENSDAKHLFEKPAQDVSKVVYNKIGKEAFSIMGAKEFVASDTGLSFKIQGSKKASLVDIIYNKKDENYNIRFYFYNNITASVKGISEDEIKNTIAKETDLPIN